jgi:two-component system NarL family sensor kinase
LPIKLKIGQKLTLVFAGFAITIILALSAIYYWEFDAALQERVKLQLSSVKRLKLLRIENQLNQLLNDFSKAGDRDFAETLDLQDEPVDLGEIRLIDLSSSAETIIIRCVERVESGYYYSDIEVPEITEIVLERTGLGETGESYIVGKDDLLRTPSRFYDTPPEGITAKTEGVIRAREGESGEDIILDYRGIEVFSSFVQKEFQGLNWVLLTEIDRQEALFPLKSLRINLLLTLVSVLIAVVILAYFISRLIVHPIVTTRKELVTMARGNLRGENDFPNRHDEIGQMLTAVSELRQSLKSAILFAQEIGKGHFDLDLAIKSDEDELGLALNSMKDQLLVLREQEKKLKEENHRSVVESEEKERRRISKDIHDGIGPLLTSLRMKIRSSGLPEKQKDEITKGIDNTISEVRRISNNLIPSVLQDFGVGEAIQNFVNSLNEQLEDLVIIYKYDDSSSAPLKASLQLTIYRVVQECINNAIKHSGASEIHVSLTEFDDHAGLFIQDNGRGFDPLEIHEGNGLRNIKERVNLNDGQIEINSGDSGTSIQIEFSINE